MKRFIDADKGFLLEQYRGYVEEFNINHFKSLIPTYMEYYGLEVDPKVFADLYKKGYTLNEACIKLLEDISPSKGSIPPIKEITT